MDESSLKISDFSKASGLSLKALRLYEKHALLVPRRSPDNGYRLYAADQLETAKEIKELRLAGFSIKEIKSLLPFRRLSDGSLDQNQPGHAARLLICKQVSASIKKLDTLQIVEMTKLISNEDYLRTIAMVDSVAKGKLLSILSDKAIALVKSDLENLDRKYADFWR